MGTPSAQGSSHFAEYPICVESILAYHRLPVSTIIALEDGEAENGRTMGRIEDVEPGDLRLPPSRQDGPNVSRYFEQVQRFGGRMDNMPTIEVTQGKDGELMINNGVTRAVRVFSCQCLFQG